MARNYCHLRTTYDYQYIMAFAGKKGTGRHLATWRMDFISRQQNIDRSIAWCEANGWKVYNPEWQDITREHR